MMVGRSTAHLEVVDRIERVARTDTEVLIIGPTGVGKELYARHLHACSHRASEAFVAVNCAGIPTQLLENELFGHAAGAYTGARSALGGLVEAAEGGTLLLDEINSLAIEGQVKLLRFLQSREYRRLGDARLRRANVRIVAATNSDLRAEADAGRFRRDLLFRLRVVPLVVKALAERTDDILPLADFF